MLRLALRQALSLPRRVVSPSTHLPLLADTKTFNNRAVIISSRMSSLSTVPNGPKDQRMIWVDCEMTGLDITKDKLIEIAVVVTDKDLNILAQGPNLVIHQSKDVMDNMNEWCINQHGLSGLTQRVLDSKIDEDEAERQIMEFVQAWTPAGKCPLAGNSVGADKKFIERFLPKLYAHLHYRIIDVSTVEVL